VLRAGRCASGDKAGYLVYLYKVLKSKSLHSARSAQEVVEV